MKRISVFPRIDLGRFAVLVLAGTITVVAACSSDEFGPVGSDLPSDVSQDSLLQLVTVRGASDEARIEFDFFDDEFLEPFDQREFLYFGSLMQEGFSATPLVRFDFTELPDTLEYAPEFMKSIRLKLTLPISDQRPPSPELAVHLLNAELDSSLVESPLNDFLGSVLAESSSLPGESLTFDLLKADGVDSLAVMTEISDWFANAGHDGIALVETTGRDSSLIGLAASDFDLFANCSLLVVDPVSSCPDNVSPGLSVEFFPSVGGIPDLLAETVTVGLRSQLDITHVQRPDLGDRLALGRHLPIRSWIAFDFSTVPSSATVNNAELVLTVDPAALIVTGDASADSLDTIAPASIDLSSYEASKDVALSKRLDDAQEIFNGRSSVSILDILDPEIPEGEIVAPPAELRVNITDYVQRIVNGLFESEAETPGVLLALNAERLRLAQVGFFSSSAADSMVWPRVEIYFTPPADFED